MTFDDYLRLAKKAKKHHPEWRVGQAYYNVLDEHRPDLSARITGGSLDPFYRNDVIELFLERVLNMWETA